MLDIHIKHNGAIFIDKCKWSRLTFKPMALNLDCHQYVHADFSQKPLGESKSIFLWSTHGMRKHKNLDMIRWFCLGHTCMTKKVAVHVR